MMQSRSAFRDAADPPQPQHTADTTMRFKLWWRHPGSKTEVEETYERVTNNPEQWSREIITWFNSTRRPGERKRLFVRCESMGEVPPAAHKWTKLTAMTQHDPRGGVPFDKMQCERCGVTGKRRGLQTYVHIDSKFRLKVYQRCDTAMKALAMEHGHAN